MKVLIFIIIVTLLFISHCTDNKYYINNDKGVVVNIKKGKNDNEITIRMISHPDKTNLTDVESYKTHKKVEVPEDERIIYKDENTYR